MLEPPPSSLPEPSMSERSLPRSLARRVGRASLFALASVAAVSCSDGTAPAGAERGRYALVRGARGVPPIVTDSSASGFRALLADTVTLDGRGRAQRAFALRIVDRVLARDTVFRYTAEALRYRRDGVRLELWVECPPNALCAGNDEGVLTRDGLVLTGAWHTGRVPLEFRRLP